MIEKIINFLNNNRLIKNLILIFIIIYCLFSLTQIQQDVFPQASPDVIMISITYPGASPKDVELNGLIPIEKKIKYILGIKEYYSFAIENYGRVLIYLDQDYHDIKGAKAEILRELNNIPDLSPDIEELFIRDANPKLRSIYEIGINIKNGYDISKKELYEFIDDFEKELNQIKGVSYIDKEGYQDREIKIKINPKKMESYYISLNEIVDSIKNRNIRSTGGTLQSVVKDKSIVTIGEFNDPLEVKDVIIRSEFGGNRVYIKNIAQVEDGFKKNNIEVRINGNIGVTLKVTKDADADVVKTAANIKKYLKLHELDFHEWVEISTITDESKSIVSLLNVLKSNAVIGFIFVFLILLVFLLDFRTSLWTAFGVPLTLIVSLTIMKFTGYTLNVITLAALITVTGMLVDDAIVIAEIIYEYKKSGLTPIKAAIKGLKEVIVPVAISSFTTIVAFLPLLNIKGMMGNFITIFPFIIGITLLVSLLEASTTLPVHLAKSKINVKDKLIWFDAVAKFYKAILKKALKLRYLTLLVFISLLVFIFYIARNNIKNFTLIEDNSSDQIFILLEAPLSTNLKTTSGLVKKAEDIVLNEIPKEELISYKTTIGHHTTSGMTQKGNHENWAIITLSLVPLTERNEDADTIIDRLRIKINTKKLKEFDKIIYQKKVLGPPSGDSVNIRIISNNRDNSINAMNEIKAFLKKIDGVYDIDDDQEKGMDELKINFNYEKMSKLGINVSNVAGTVRTAYEGVIATKINTIDDEINFRVQIDDNYQSNINFLLNLLIPNKKGNLIKLKDIAYLSNQKAESTINHYNGENVINVTSNLDEKKITPRNISKLIMNNFNDKYPDVKILLGGTGKETIDTISGLIISFLMAILLIYFLLLLLYKNFVLPFLIFIEIPFSIMGALIGLIIHDLNLTLLSSIGIIGLCGVAVNDNVVMIDFINKSIKNKKDKSKYIEIVSDAAKRRLRPVMLTTVTTVGALIPTILGIGGYAGLIVPVAVVMAYGLVIDTLVTIFFIPLVFLIYLDIKGIIDRIKNKIKII